MKNKDWLLLLIGVMFLSLFSACNPQGIVETQTDVPPQSATVATELSTATNAPSQTVTFTPSATATEIASTATLKTTATLLPSPSPEPCKKNECVYAGQFFLQRPIDPSNNDIVDVTYRFGTTQGGLREPHHGVEFLNPYGTPVLAAGDGEVVVAGQDDEPITERGVWPIEYYGKFASFYGNLVVIEHQPPESLLALVPDYPVPVYSLYGHLSEIDVEVGDKVKVGDIVGKVGMAGTAIGPHLHFEVRLGENKYPNSRNPELYLAPHKDENGELNGGLAGSILDSWGNYPEVKEIVLTHLPDGADEPGDLRVYLQTYQEKDLLGELPWNESFAAGDIPPGLYRMTFPYYGLREVMFKIFPGKLTVLNLVY